MLLYSFTHYESLSSYQTYPVWWNTFYIQNAKYSELMCLSQFEQLTCWDKADIKSRDLVCVSPLRAEDRWKHISGSIRRINSRCCTLSVFPPQKTASCSRKWRSGHALIKKPLTCTSALCCPLHLSISCGPLWPAFIISHLQLFNLSIRSGGIKEPSRGWAWRDAAVDEKLRRVEEQIHLLWTSLCGR